MNELENRKNKLKELALNMEHCSNGGMIYKLINEGSLDEAISKLDNKKVSLNCSSVVKKGFLTADEQFIDMINNFLHYLDFDFSILGSNKELITSALFKNTTPAFVLCKNDWGDNDFIPYFTFNIKQFIVTGFYNTLKRLGKVNPLLYSQLNLQKKMNLKNGKDVEKLYNVLSNLAWCNIKEFGLYFAFLDINKYDPIHPKNTSNEDIINGINNYYLTQLDRLIENYTKKEKVIEQIINN